MANCPIARAVTKHCVEDEVIECPKCSGVMLFSPFDREILQCTNEDCFHLIDTQGE